MGRPPIHAKAMTDAERQRRRRDLKAHAQNIRAAMNKVEASKKLQADGFLDIVTLIAGAGRDGVSDDEIKQLMEGLPMLEGLPSVDPLDRGGWMAMAEHPEKIRAIVDKAMSDRLQEAAAMVAEKTA